MPSKKSLSIALALSITFLSVPVSANNTPQSTRIQTIAGNLFFGSTLSFISLLGVGLCAPATAQFTYYALESGMNALKKLKNKIKGKSLEEKLEVEESRGIVHDIFGATLLSMGALSVGIATTTFACFSVLFPLGAVKATLENESMITTSCS